MEVFFWLVMMAVFSGFSMNLMLQFGLGLKELILTEYPDNGENAITANTLDKKKFLVELCIIFVTILLLWLVFVLIRSLLPLGFFEFILLFPVSYMVFFALECLSVRIKKGILSMPEKGSENRFCAGGIFSGSGLFVALNIAGGIAETIALSFGFILGIALAVLIIEEIRRRSEMEAVPQFLRGGPLLLIAMGLLSLIFSSAAATFFEVLTAG